MDEKQTPSMLSNGLPPPPVPKRLREMLKDYPGHLEKLQAVLNVVVEKPMRATPHFQRAIWMLEGQTSAFIREAQVELEQAQASGDAEAIARAEAKASLMRRARSANVGLGDLDDLWGYLEDHKDAVK